MRPTIAHVEALKTKSTSDRSMTINNGRRSRPSSATNAGGVKTHTSPTLSPKHAVPSHGNNGNTSPTDTTPKVNATFKKAIVGDIFGSSESLAGLMYRSRVIEMKEEVLKEEKIEENSTMDSVVSSVEVADSESDSDNELKMLKRMNPKQQLAVTIKNWSVIPENDQHIIKEGSIPALIALSLIDDSLIRRCCASSFYHLSSRAANRKELLDNGATTGIITLAMQASRNWKVAKLCSLSLCYLSMENEEATMAKEGATLALVVLLGIKGQSLLPICVQALYNLTCTTDHFKGVERIIKALLNITSSGFDHSDFLMKALVNCSRYSWMRLRIIEDGALTSINSLLSTLHYRDNRKELTLNILVAMKSLSESSGCRSEMLSKGSVEILNALLGYCDEKGKLYVIKILHNFLQTPGQMSNNSFEISVNIVSNIVCDTSQLLTLQYCAACFHIFTREHIRGIHHLAVLIIDSMTILLRSNDPLTQFFAISTSGNLFFNNLCTNPQKIELLVKNFVKHGPNIKDPAANQALALALAKLSQEDAYMEVIERLRLFKSVLELLMSLLDMHKNSLLLQESCCIAICRIALKLDYVDNLDKQRIAQVFVNMLTTDDQYVLSSTISGIQALGSSGLCPKELLSETLLSRIASIVAKYKNEIELCRTGCAVLAVFSYDVEAHDLLAAENIMKVLFTNIRAEDGITKELVANTLCNISVNSNASTTMIKMDVVEVLATLANSTSEAILELCSKCICNLTCNVSLHRKMIENKILDIILMIALVRTVNNPTKLVCAKALLNLITDENLKAIEDSGAIRVFASLSTINNPPIQYICAKGLYLLTLNQERRKELVQRRAVLQALFNMVKCQSSRTRIKVGTSICNLLACPVTNKSTIRAGALSVLKIIATMDFEELREATARVIINLAVDPTIQPSLMREPIVPILVLILQQSSDYTFECAIFALTCLSQYKEFKALLIDQGCVTAMIGTLLSGKVSTPIIAEEVCRCLCHLSYHYDKALAMVQSGHMFLALHAIYLSGLCSADTALLIVLIMRNVSESLAARRYIIEQDAFKLLVSIVTDFNQSRFNCTIMYSALVTFMYNLSLVPTLHSALVNQGLMKLLKKICLYGDMDNNTYQHPSNMSAVATATQTATATSTTLGGVSNVTTSADSNYISSEGGDGMLPTMNNNISINAMTTVARVVGSLLYRKDHRKSIIKQSPENTFEALLNFTHNEIDYISKTINLLSQTHSCHQMIVEGGVMKIYKALIDGLSEGSRSEIASSLANISGTKQCRETLVRQGATELLIALSVTSDANTQAQCALALGYLSELTKVNNGVVASLLLLSLHLEEFNTFPVQHTEGTILINNRETHHTMPSMAKDLIKDLKLESGEKMSSISLINMIRENMSERKKFDDYYDRLKKGNDKNLETNYFVPRDKNKCVDEYEKYLINNQKPPTSKLQVHDENNKLILHEESSVLSCMFDNYRYEATSSNESIEPESGGMSVKTLAELPLPGIPADRDLEPVNRHTELSSLPVTNDPLPKDLRKPHPLDHTKSQLDLQHHDSSLLAKNNQQTTDAAASSLSGAAGLNNMGSSSIHHHPGIAATGKQHSEDSNISGNNNNNNVHNVKFNKAQSSLSRSHTPQDHHNNNNNNMNNNNPLLDQSGNLFKKSNTKKSSTERDKNPMAKSKSEITIPQTIDKLPGAAWKKSSHHYQASSKNMN